VSVAHFLGNATGTATNDTQILQILERQLACARVARALRMNQCVPHCCACMVWELQRITCMAGHWSVLKCVPVLVPPSHKQEQTVVANSPVRRMRARCLHPPFGWGYCAQCSVQCLVKRFQNLFVSHSSRGCACSMPLRLRYVQT